MRIFKAGQVNEPDAITDGPLDVGACAQGKPGLANAARSHQRQQTRARECRFDLRQQFPPAYEARGLCGEPARDRSIGYGHTAQCRRVSSPAPFGLERIERARPGLHPTGLDENRYAASGGAVRRAARPAYASG